MTKREVTYTIKLCDEERRMLAAVGEKLRRRDSDVVRLLIRAAAEDLLTPSLQEGMGVVNERLQ